MSSGEGIRIFNWLNRKDILVAKWMDTHCQVMMRISLALICWLWDAISGEINDLNSFIII